MLFRVFSPAHCFVHNIARIEADFARIIEAELPKAFEKLIEI
jgi:hypothetical protein